MAQPITKAIVPAAGLGTRLLPATKSQPKEMLPVGRKPVVQYVVEELQAAGLQQILIVTGRRVALQPLGNDPFEELGHAAVLRTRRTFENVLEIRIDPPAVDLGSCSHA